MMTSLGGTHEWFPHTTYLPIDIWAADLASLVTFLGRRHFLYITQTNTFPFRYQSTTIGTSFHRKKSNTYQRKNSSFLQRTYYSYVAVESVMVATDSNDDDKGSQTRQTNASSLDSYLGLIDERDLGGFLSHHGSTLVTLVNETGGLGVVVSFPTGTPSEITLPKLA